MFDKISKKINFIVANRCLPLYTWMIWQTKLTKRYYQKEEIFYSHLNMSDMTNGSYTHRKWILKNFKTKDLGAYDYLHVQSKTLLLTDVFPNFQIMYFKIYGLNPARFLNPQGLICQATLKKLK